MRGIQVDTATPPYRPTLRYARQCRRTVALLVCGDTLAILTLALLISPWLPDAFADANRTIALTCIVAVPLIFFPFGLYGFRAVTMPPLDEAQAVARALATLAFTAIIAWILLAPGQVTRAVAVSVIAWMVGVFVVCLLARSLVRQRARRIHPERVVIYGAGHTGQTMAERIMASGTGIEVVGFVDDNPMDLRPGLEAIPVLPESQGITHALREADATRLVLAFSSSPSHQVLEAIRTSEFGGLPISIVPRYFEITPSHSSLSEINGMPLVEIRSAQLSLTARVTKRAIDMALSAGALVVLAPLLAATAIAIKLDSRGPVVFRQERLGSNGVPFHILKFRSMVMDAEAQRHALADMNEMEGSGPLFKIKDDPRITRVGSFLRRTSLDELPQLYNVLVGHMSLVGPRPFVTHEAIQIDGWGSRRLDIKPGITGLWQVRGRNDVPFDEMVRLDYMYVTNWSLWWDIRLILQTIPRVLSGRGAS